MGSQYRSAVFYHTTEQKETAEAVIGELEERGVWDSPIVTEVEELTAFYPAEDYHRDYFERNPAQPYCSVVIAPKVAKFRRLYLDRLKK